MKILIANILIGLASSSGFAGGAVVVGGYPPTKPGPIENYSYQCVISIIEQKNNTLAAAKTAFVLEKNDFKMFYVPTAQIVTSADMVWIEDKNYGNNVSIPKRLSNHSIVLSIIPISKVEFGLRLGLKASVNLTDPLWSSSESTISFQNTGIINASVSISFREKKENILTMRASCQRIL